jgi:hypothetical protein
MPLGAEHSERRPRSAYALLYPLLDAPHGGVDSRERLLAPLNGQIRQIDIDRQTRHVANEQIDARASLEREAVFARNFGQGSHDERALLAIDFTEWHRGSPALLSDRHGLACRL